MALNKVTGENRPDLAQVGVVVETTATRNLDEISLVGAPNRDCIFMNGYECA